MARRKESEYDLDLGNEPVRRMVTPEYTEPAVQETHNTERYSDGEGLQSCLLNKKVIVRHVPRQGGLVTSTKHELSGGMATNATRQYIVKVEPSGMLKQVLTKAEQDYLEYLMDLPKGALNIHKRENNFWINKTVTLTKQDTFLDLSNPMDFINYKILLTNDGEIAASQETLDDKPKATYKFVIIEEDNDLKKTTVKMNIAMECIKAYGKLEDDAELLRTALEILSGKPLSEDSKLVFLQSKVYEYVVSNPSLTVKILKDPLLRTKALVKKAVTRNIIAKRGDFFYLADTNTPLCESKQDPTFNNAAKYLEDPRNQVLKLSITEKLK